MRTIGDYGVFDPNVAFEALIRTAQYDAIPPEDCRIGFAYWGIGRAIGEVAICRSEGESGVSFEGLRNKLGQDALFRERHYDQNGLFGTWRPLAELELAPDHMGEQETMSWLLQQEIIVAEERLEWITAMPAQLQGAKGYRDELELAKESLDELRGFQRDGFSLQLTVTFRGILEEARQRRANTGTNR